MNRARRAWKGLEGIRRQGKGWGWEVKEIGRALKSSERWKKGWDGQQKGWKRT